MQISVHLPSGSKIRCCCSSGRRRFPKGCETPSDAACPAYLSTSWPTTKHKSLLYYCQNHPRAAVYSHCLILIPHCEVNTIICECGDKSIPRYMKGIASKTMIHHCFIFFIFYFFARGLYQLNAAYKKNQRSSGLFLNNENV